MIPLREALAAAAGNLEGRPLLVVQRTPEERREHFLERHRANSRKAYQRKKGAGE